MSFTIMPRTHRAEHHTAAQARMLSRLSDFYAVSDPDKAAGLAYEAQAVIIASSATATRYPQTFRLQEKAQ